MRAPLAPALRWGLYAGIPVGIAFYVDLRLDSAALGALSLGTLLAGLVAFEAPPRIRLVWQLAVAPVIGLAAALGALTGDIAWLAALTITAVASLAGFTSAVSPRLAVAAITCVLALLLAQGTETHASDVPALLVLGAAGVGFQALFTLASILPTGQTPDPAPGPGPRETVSLMRAGLRRGSPTLHHAIRWGVAIGIATALYHVIDLRPHGYWIPLTVLFVLRPTPDETVERIAMRAAGTVLGLVIATPLAIALGGDALPEAIVIGVTVGFALALLAIQYALFTAALTACVVILAHALGESASEAADERAVATAIGLVIAGGAILTLRDRTTR